ncbi:glycoside hydrolase family 5 protein [Mycobacterium sp. MYCO198283]|uniref:glycoside hydrolase family 5 protein n=1 Tax=Mycobacterium sp. MYCO198283 TaxID=2883505 RepID=UPI001E5961D8|nr:cellulase family glycosylhydrolase [Mycobacterium sp. MYCO198283]MCG5431396.1 glycoside hydrolase family 5 protein [Mycobacterium sp. MYCO198283]
MTAVGSRRRRIRVAALFAAVLLAGTGCAPPPKPLAGPFLRGVNNMTFLWFAGYDGHAGNESAASYAFQAARGVDVVRLPISWERIQPQLGGPLSTDEVSRLRTEINRAQAAGIRVVVDLHNGCRYRLPDGSVAVCSRGITVEQFADVWTRLSRALRGQPGIQAYDLMNEPNDLTGDGTNTRDDAKIWERFSQAAVDAIRAEGDRRRLLIEGVSWSNVDAFDDLHPTAWIDDPAGELVYSAHHYFDQSGRYAVPGSAVPELRYSYWEKRLTDAGTTGDKSFDDWNLDRLDQFVRWIARHRVHGDIGEVGWPSAEAMTALGVPADEARAEAQRWNDLGERWYRAADAASLSVTFWVAGGVQFADFPGAPAGSPDPNAVFVHAGGNGELRDGAGHLVVNSAGRYEPRDVDHANSQYEVLLRHPSSGRYPPTTAQ